MEYSTAGKLQYEIVHRFYMKQVPIFDRMSWPIVGFYADACEGLQKLGRTGGEIRSIGIDSWGCDFGLFDRYGQMIGTCFNGKSKAYGWDLVAELFKVIPKKELYRLTGLQNMLPNSIIRLFGIKKNAPEHFDRAEHFLMIADIFKFFLTGVAKNEFTTATTTQVYRADHSGWSDEVISRLGLPRHLFGQVDYPATNHYPLLPDVEERLGLKSVKVATIAAHDTASAVVCVPSLEEQFLYISSGTGSIMGTETKESLLNETTWHYNIANEGGPFHTNRLLKNIFQGMYLFEELRREWAQKGMETDYEFLRQEAEKAPELRCFVDPDDPDLVVVGTMQSAIDRFLKKTNQPLPDGQGGYVRCVLESLAMKYRNVAQLFRSLTGNPYDTIHIVGGGSRNKMMNQFAANACSARVLAGPTEATSIGNALMQIAADEGIDNLKDLRAIVQRSFPVDEFLPQDTEKWDEAYERFKPLMYTGGFNYDD